MAKLNVFIDGSWLFNACRADRALACTTEYSDKNFHLDFRRLNAALLKHVESEAKPKEQIELGKLILATSIFEIPEGVEQWPAEYPEKCTAEGIGRVRNGVFARERFIEGA